MCNSSLHRVQQPKGDEVAKETGVVYEELDKVAEHPKKRELPRPPNGEFELTQCAAYGPATTDIYDN